MIGRGIARPIQALVTPALDIGEGKSVSIAPLDLKEADEVRQALLKAQQLLEQREQERNQAEQAERKMLLAKQAAEQANQAKAAFLANMSHELRTPLNAILGFARLMRNAPDASAEQIQNLDIINRSGEHLLRLINSVLDISKIESGHIALEEDSFDLHRLLHELRSLMQAQAAEKGLGFTMLLSPDLPRFVSADSGKLRQVLINLLDNAIKFTTRGGVVLRAEVARRQFEQTERVRFEVEDSGPGIPAEDMERIFSPFERLGDTTTAQPGTGLGLFISKQYVELMGGQIGVRTQLAKGTVFHFEIALRMASPSGEIAATALHRRAAGLMPGQPRYRLLIVEDQADSRLLLHRLLEPIGFDLREAVDGRQAVELFGQWHPHLVWMDIRMPVMDGLEATRRIKASRSGAQTKIVAITAHALEEERREILAAGCDDFIRKPYRETEVFDALERNLGVRFLYAGEQPSAAAKDAGDMSMAQLGKLPPDLLEELRQAAVLLDGERCLGIIAKIASFDRQTGARLERMVNDLQYHALLALMDRSAGTRPA